MLAKGARGSPINYPSIKSCSLLVYAEKSFYNLVLWKQRVLIKKTIYKSTLWRFIRARIGYAYKVGSFLFVFFHYEDGELSASLCSDRVGKGSSFQLIIYRFMKIKMSIERLPIVVVWNSWEYSCNR